MGAIAASTKATSTPEQTQVNQLFHAPERGDDCTICLDLHLATCSPPANAPAALHGRAGPVGLLSITAESHEDPRPLRQLRGRAPPATA